MAVTGLKAIKIGVLDANDKVDPTKIYTIDMTTAGAIEANVTGLAPAETSLYASNGVYYVSVKGTGQVKLALTVADKESLVAGALEAILGQTKGSDKISYTSPDDVPPYCAVEIITSDKDGNDLFMGLLKGKFTFDAVDAKTNDANGSPLSADVLNGSFVTRADKNAVTAKGMAAAPDNVTQTVFETMLFPAAA